MRGTTAMLPFCDTALQKVLFPLNVVHHRLIHFPIPTRSPFLMTLNPLWNTDEVYNVPVTMIGQCKTSLGTYIKQSVNLILLYVSLNKQRNN